MLYSGQLDIIVAAPLTERMLWNLQWKYQDEYKSCKKQVWKVRQSDTEVAGYVRHVQNFCQVSDVSDKILIRTHNKCIEPKEDVKCVHHT